MGNIGATIKRFLSNKNTITILGVILGIVVLYVGYNWRVSSAIEQVTIPYATKTLTATTPITKDVVGSTQVLRSFVTGNENLIQSSGNLTGGTTNNCVNVGTSIPKGAFFYTEQVVNCNSISSNVFDNMPDGYRPVSIEVNLRSTYGNSMYPNNSIDIYVRTTDEDRKLVYGEFITKLPILDVRDSAGKSLYYGTSSNGTPSVLLFAVPNCDSAGTNLYLLLSKASMLSDIELVPVPGNKSYTSEVGETTVSSEYLKQMIINKTAIIPDENVSGAGSCSNTNNNNSNNNNDNNNNSDTNSNTNN